VAWALGQAGASGVTIVNRSPEPAARAATLAGPRGQVGTVDAVTGADLVVNATPLGMGAGAAVQELPLPRDVVEALRADQLVVDLIYDPAPTPLLLAAATAGARTLDGRGMLVHQAAHAFRRWTGAEPPVDVMIDAVDTELVRRAGEAATEGHARGSGRDGRATRR
jgi:shikimate dehydrogenase